MTRSQSTFAERRSRVFAEIDPGVLVLPAARVALRNNDVEHEYRQDSDLFYLTGFAEPGTVLVMVAGKEPRTILFVRPRDPEREVWDGARAGVDGAKSDFGADAAYPIDELDTRLVDLLQDRGRLFYRLGLDRDFDDRVLRAIDGVRARARRGARHPTQIVDPATVLHEMRRLKSAQEVERMRKAIEITRDAHVEAMKQCAPGMFEYEIEALLRARFRKSGSERPAYPPIVGSGPNATVLHYVTNDRRMHAGDLLLIDAGCELEYYASDITRTFPVGGTFSGPQRAIYEVVLEAQQASIDAVRPGATLDEIHRASVDRITRGLVDLGIVDGPASDALEHERYKPFFMHKTSHYLGMDVHDVGTYFEDGQHRRLDEGVVITVEPGIYIAAESDASEAYRGIGVRIEDDVLVTGEGCRVLSDDIPKTVADVERACAR